MLSKLALRNVRRSVKDYAVYFLTLTFGVCIFYTFSSLEGQSVISFLGGHDKKYLVESIFLLVDVFSAFVAVVLAGLILYANQFLMKRRKRELGTYFLLGLDTSKVSRLLVGETLLIGLAALLSGLALGSLCSWALDKLTMAMFLATPPDLFSFHISLGAVGKTVLYFGVMFLVVMLFTGVSVSRARLIDLMRSGRTNEEMAQRSLVVSVSLFLLGCVSLGTAYAILLLRGLLAIDLLWFVMLGLGTLGTFLIFRSLSGFLLRLTKGHPGYYKGLNMFILRQWSGKVHTNCLSNTVICILLLLAMGVTACSVGLNDTISSVTRTDSPFDLSLSIYPPDEGNFTPVDPASLWDAAGLDPEAVFSQAESFLLYYNDRELTGESGYPGVISLTDYNRAMAARGLAPMEGPLPAPSQAAMDNNYGPGRVLVVEDEMAARLELSRQMMNFTFRGEAYAAYEQVKAAIGPLAEAGSLSLWANFRLDNYFDLMGSKLLVLYMGLYLGLVFLVTAGAVLALQQLSQAADNAHRYQLLAKLGAPRTMCRGALIRQVGLAFLLPLALGVIHTFVGMAAANQVINELGHVDSVRSSLLTAGFLLLIYGGYFLCTCLGAWRAVKSDG